MVVGVAGAVGSGVDVGSTEVRSRSGTGTRLDRRSREWRGKLGAVVDGVIGVEDWTEPEAGRDAAPETIRE